MPLNRSLLLVQLLPLSLVTGICLASPAYADQDHFTRHERVEGNNGDDGHNWINRGDNDRDDHSDNDGIKKDVHNWINRGDNDRDDHSDNDGIKKDVHNWINRGDNDRGDRFRQRRERSGTCYSRTFQLARDGSGPAGRGSVPEAFELIGVRSAAVRELPGVQQRIVVARGAAKVAATGIRLRPGTICGHLTSPELDLFLGCRRSGRKLRHLLRAHSPQ